MPVLRTSTETGFSLVDVLLVIALVATVAAIAVPAATSATELMRLGAATRAVERELHSARLRAVSTNRRLVVRLNCPAAGQLRMVELTGLARIDQDANRCDERSFPYPGRNDANPLTPAADGPIRRLHPSIDVSGPDIVFLSNGTTATLESNVASRIINPVSVTIARERESASIVVNSLGKITSQ